MKSTGFTTALLKNHSVTSARKHLKIHLFKSSFQLSVHLFTPTTWLIDLEYLLTIAFVNSFISLACLVPLPREDIAPAKQ